MSEVFKAYPLQWPVGWKRTEPERRRDGQGVLDRWRAAQNPVDPGLEGEGLGARYRPGTPGAGGAGSCRHAASAARYRRRQSAWVAVSARSSLILASPGSAFVALS